MKQSADFVSIYHLSIDVGGRRDYKFTMKIVNYLVSLCVKSWWVDGGLLNAEGRQRVAVVSPVVATAVALRFDASLRKWCTWKDEG